MVEGRHQDGVSGGWTTVLLVVASCGPVATTGTGGTGSGTSSTSAVTSTGGGDTSTRGDVGESTLSTSGGEEFCGGEPFSENAWCHSAVDFDVSPMVVKRILGHVVPSPSGSTSLILQGRGAPQSPEAFLRLVYQEFVLVDDDPGFELTGFGVEASLGSTDLLIPVRIFTDAAGRHDYLPDRITGSCSGALSVPSPERVAEFGPEQPGTVGAVQYGFDGCRRTPFSPIALAGTAVDSFFYACGEEAYCVSIDPEPPTGWLTSRKDMPVVQTLASPHCTADVLWGPDAIVPGRFDGTGTESLVLLRRPCGEEAVGELQIIVDDGGGRVAWGDQLPLGDFAGTVRVLRVYDLDQDGFDDLLLLGHEAFGLMFGSEDGLTGPHPYPVVPLALPYFETDPVPGGLEEVFPPNVRVGAGQLDSTPELELVVRVADGVAVVSLDGERTVLLDEQASDFAVVDVDADGIDDLALIYDEGDRVRIYRSSPASVLPTVVSSVAPASALGGLESSPHPAGMRTVDSNVGQRRWDE